MKKTIIKLITLIAAFLIGIIGSSYYFNKGNLDMTTTMADATLPILYFEADGELVNQTFGYTEEIDAACLRDSVMPLNEQRVLKFALEKYNSDIKSVKYEVRSSDMSRLIQNGEAENLLDEGGYLKGSVEIKDLLEDTEEYFIVFYVESEHEKVTRFFARITGSSEELVKECTNFAKEFHYATLDPKNTYPLTQYLETDMNRSEKSLAYADIHSKYKTIIWDGMPVEESQLPMITYLELAKDVVSLQMDYQVIYENEGEEEIYEVTDYFRVRRANQRMYLLDYERKAERSFTAEDLFFGKNELNLGIQWEDIHYMSNEEGSVVNFVVSDELWSYDAAQNKLSKVFSFKNGKDRRGLQDAHKIQIVNMEDSGSMDFIVTGHMNRGTHEGENGVAVLRYNSLTNTTEELIFIKSTTCAEILFQTVGELLYISHDDRMYISYEGNIYAIDLNTKNVEILTENLMAGEYLISKGGDMIAWQYGEDKYSTTSIATMDMKTGAKQTYAAGSGEFIRALAFSGEDFVYGVCQASDVIEDYAGNTIVPMHCVRIMDSNGDLIREFDYSSKNKYVISASSQNNRINLQCISVNSDGTYQEALSEAITSNEEEHVKSIALSEKKDDIKKIEKVFSFKTEIEGKRKDIVPKQIAFEDNRNIVLEGETGFYVYRAYAKGELQGVYPELRDAIFAADAKMGVVTDSDGRVVWERGNRKTRAILDAANGMEPGEAQDVLEACIGFLLGQEGIYVDVRALLNEGNSPYEILKEHSKKHTENFTGCNLSSVLYYISNGNYIFAMTAPDSGEIIAGYDAQNIYILNPQSGDVTKVGQKDAAAKYEAAGNVFFGFVK